MVRKLCLVVVLLLLSALAVQAQEPSITDIAWNADGTLLAIGWSDRDTPLEIRNVVTGNNYFYVLGLVENGYIVSVDIEWSPANPNLLAIVTPSTPVEIFEIADDRLNFVHQLNHPQIWHVY